MGKFVDRQAQSINRKASPLNMSSLQLRDVKKHFGTVEIIKGVSLDVSAGEFVVFVGPSGCGKSTLLRMIAGLEEVSEGSITLAGNDVTYLAPSKRNVALVFQSYALYPHMTVEENLTFGMRMRGVDKSTIAEKVAMAVDMLRLKPYLNRKPGALSGGQAQRVAIGRALVQEPAIFLFDEPLSNLDAELRTSMRIELSTLHKQLGKTMIYVTHDQVEAMTLADKIVVLRDGKIEQIGSPIELYENPKNIFVAGFIGSPAMNFIEAKITAINNGTATIELPNGTQLRKSLMAAQLGVCKIGVRPEHCVISDSGIITAHVKAVEKLGARAYIYADYLAQTICIESVSSDFEMGQPIQVKLNHDALHVFDSSGLNHNNAYD